MFLLLAALVAAVAAEQCNQICHPTWEPVCGSDGHTYGNNCELESLSCIRKTNVRKIYNGECTPRKTEKLTGCQQMCTMDYTPVCGTDGVTYGNECELRSLSCLRRNGVQAAYQGECCKTICTMNWEPVCGSDGVTYGNDCELESLSCQRRSGVVKAFDGMCQDTGAECPLACTMDYSPVCGTDGHTYGNECELTSQACLRKSGVTKSFDGECQEECNMICTMDYNPVCGTDGVTYGNKCELRSLSCLRRKSVRIAKMGEC